jgi:signal transduction histidine kinase
MKPVSEGDLLAAVDARLARREVTRREGERRIDEMRRTVVALLPHEIRTPLTTIIGSARLLQEFHGDFGPKDIEEMATGILKAAQRLHRMAENYILHADLEMQRLSSPPGARPLAGSSGAADVQAAAREAAAQRSRAEDLDLATEDVQVPVAAAYLRKITAELCDNALKFSAAGQRVRVSLTAREGGCQVEISDAGRGMTAEQWREVGAFRQFDRSRYEQQGSGVGLALVRSIAEVSGGLLELTGGPSGGTIARVRWPAVVGG